MSAPHRLLIVDDHAVIRWGLRAVIEQAPGLEVAAEADTVPEALDLLATTAVDAVVLDLTLYDAGGIEGIRRLRDAHPDLPIVVFSLHHERYFAERALRAGAQGYVMKSEPPGHLLEAVRRVIAGELYMSEALTERLLRRALDGQEGIDPTEQLSDREQEVLKLIGEGLGTRAIAERLGLSVKTVESYRANIKRKLSLDSAAALARFAFEWLRDTLDVPKEDAHAVGSTSPNGEAA